MLITATAGMTEDVDGRELKELLYRVEAERLQLQQRAAGLAEDKQQLTADVFQLQKQLAEAHAAVSEGQQQLAQLSTARSRLQVQLQAATTEYRANDIIAVGLREHITRLQHQLGDCQDVCSQQAAEIATFADNMAALRACKVELTQQLSDLNQQHQQLQEQHANTQHQLSKIQQDAQDIQRRWVDEHGDQARQLQAMQAARQQAENRVGELTAQLEEEEQQLAQQRSRCAELEAEVSAIRELVVLLGATMGRQHGAQQLPSHDDPVWLKLGQLGGVSFALDSVIKHTREQHVRVRELQSEFDKMEDRVRAESAQKADLQSELYDARTMYAKAVAVREALEARTTRAEAEKAAAEASLQQARTQAGEDSSCLTALQDQVLSLTQQVQQLQPLQPRLSTAEVERDTALHKLERLQEQYDQLQRQLQHATAREAGLQAEVDEYKLEHSQLLSANAQLMSQCTELNKEVQALEVNVREGSLAKEQLEEAKRKLNRTKTQLQAMTDRHVNTLNRLETTKDLLTAGPGGDGSGVPGEGGQGRSSRPASAWSRGSRPSTATRLSGLPGSTGSSPRASPRSSNIGTPAQQQAAHAAPPATAASAAGAKGPQVQQAQSAVPAGNPLHVSSAGSLVASCTTAVNGGGSAVCEAAATPAPATQQHAQELVGDDEVERSSTSQDLDTLLRQRELERLAADQQEELDELQGQLQQQQQQIAELEVQLLQQEAQHLEQLRASEESVSTQCLSAAAEAVAALQGALQDLQAALQGPSGQVGEGCSSTVSQAPDQQQQQQGQPQHKAWLPWVAAEMLSSSQAIVDVVQARARLIAARQHVGVQSDEAVQSQWLRFLRGLPDASVSQPLHLKAASEALVRVCLRGLNHLEARTHQRQHGQGPAAGAAGGGSVLTLFDLLMAHYSPPAQPHPQQQGRLAVQPYSAALWADPQGPITRLLVSCRILAPSSVKVSLFCCLAGTHSLGRAGPWGVQHWQQLMLLLHAAKQLTGGLWKGVLRDWATPAGALLPLQCVIDLLGNAYNANSLAALEQQPALLGSKQQLLNAVQLETALQAVASSRPGSVASITSRCGGSRGGSGGPGRDTAGTVAAALRELLVDGPLGPASAVDFDDLLALLMVQFDAGLLPQHPLLQPRRLTTGDLANTTNAWGSAATEAGVMAPRRPTLLSPGTTLTGLAAEPSESGRSEWSLGPNSPSAVSAAGGFGSRPTTGAAASRIGTAATEKGAASLRTAQQPGSQRGAAAGSGLSLPRIRTPDDATQPARRSSSSNGAQPTAGALPPAPSKQPPNIKKGVSVARVAFKDPGSLNRQN